MQETSSAVPYFFKIKILNTQPNIFLITLAKAPIPHSTTLVLHGCKISLSALARLKRKIIQFKILKHNLFFKI